MRGLGERIRRLWQRLRTWFRRTVPTAPPAAPLPGRTIEGTAASPRGWLGIAPWCPPRRQYLLHVPSGSGGPRPLVVWIHGCHQSPEHFAAGTRILQWADRSGLFVLLPRQTRLANSSSCWNWFDGPTTSGRGETAIVLEQIAKVRLDHPIDADRIFVGGLSSGAALAALLAVRSPLLFAGLALHSGVAAGAATSALSARRVLVDGPEVDVAAIGRRARQAQARQFRLPALIVHGIGDASVSIAHAAALVRQMLALNGDADVSRTTREPDRRRREPAGAALVDEFDVDGRIAVRLVQIEGLGHAWSGGDGTLPYNAADAPDATRMMLDFFEESVPAAVH